MTLSPVRRLGRAEIGGRSFAVGPGVFCPQPETADVADGAARACPAARLVVDLCAGGGTLGLLVADRLPHVTVHAVELSPDALPWLERNCRGTRVIPHLGDASWALPDLDGTVDLVVSNPPYVATHELDQVEPSVRDHDPREALLAGTDGPDLVRVVARRALRLLRPGGVLVGEHSDRQGRSAPEALRSLGFRHVGDHPDSAGKDRFTTAYAVAAGGHA